jgi:hypothetical protein
MSDIQLFSLSNGRVSELTLRMQADLERAKPLMERSYTET